MNSPTKSIEATTRTALLQVLGPLPWLAKGQGEVRPTDQIQLIRPADGGHELALARWGFVPTGMGMAELKKYAMFNARIETLRESRAFGPAFQCQRCVIPMSAFYEWPVMAGKKQKTRLSRPDGLPLLVAGLWNRCEGSEGTVESCTLVTRPPTSDLLSVHDRIPALLLSKDLKTWLHGAPEVAQTAALTSWRPGVLSVQAACPRERSTKVSADAKRQAYCRRNACSLSAGSRRQRAPWSPPDVQCRGRKG